MSIALQDLGDPDGICFGCGAANPDGLRMKSYWSEDGSRVVTTIDPPRLFTGWPGLVYGGFLAMLVDCHSNWTAIAWNYKVEGREPGSLPLIHCVTGQLGVRYHKPTPMGVPLALSAWVEGEITRKCRVLCEIRAEGILTVTGDSIFVKADPTALAANAVHGHSI